MTGVNYIPINLPYGHETAHKDPDIVHGLGHLHGLYVMLADLIEILESLSADALKEEMRDFVAKYLR